MSRCVNEVLLIGNTGADPEVRTTAKGSLVAKVSLATSRSYKGEERTDWHTLKFFGRLAQVVDEFVKKGDRLYVRGRIEYSKSESDGVTRHWTDIIVNDLVMLGDTRPQVVAKDDSDLPDLDF